MKKQIRWLLGLLFIFPAAHAYADLLHNESFESFTAGLPDDWNASGNLAVINTQGASDGAFALAFSFGNLPSNGSIWQTFATVAGMDYRLEFDFGKYSINQPNEVARLLVDIFDGDDFFGETLLSETVTDATPGLGDPNSTNSPEVFDPYLYEFTAIGILSTIRFEDISDPQSPGGGFDAMLDHVRISEIPEPSSVSFFTLAIIAGFCHLRKVKRARRQT